MPIANNRLAEGPSPDDREGNPPVHRYGEMQVLQTQIELQKDITEIATQQRRLIEDVAELDGKVDKLNEFKTLAKGVGIGVGFVIPVCAWFLWWTIGDKIDHARDQILAAQPPADTGHIGGHEKRKAGQ